MAIGIKRQISKALAKVKAEISANSQGKYGRGLAGEGYAGGYRDALRDVTAALNGVPISNSRFWPLSDE